MENPNFIAGGKTGDLIHNLLVVKKIFEKTNFKAKLYITDNSSYGGDPFNFHILTTYNDLYPVIIKQEYIDSFEILTPEIKLEKFFNLNSWRQCKLVYSSCWTEILAETYNIDTNISSWLKFDTIDDLNDTVLIHRSTHRHNPHFPWESVVKNNKCKFITHRNTLHEYEIFPFKNNVELLICESFSDFVKYINSCKIFVGNMSAPLAIAHALNKPHFGELIFPDEIHYIGEKKYFNNFYYTKYNGEKSIDGIENFLNL
jgi:hypothetical protein